MNIVVTIKHIPNTADDLPVKGSNLDFDAIDFVINEFDEQAVEQAVLVKEAVGGSVTVIGVDLTGEMDTILHTALAKGADRVIKIAVDDPAADSHQQAAWLADAVRSISPDLIFTGVQASNDLDGQAGPMLAAYLDFPYIGGISAVDLSTGALIVNKEFAGGVSGRYSVSLPAVIGVQASSKPPRYAPISKIRQAAQTGVVEKIAPSTGGNPSLKINSLTAPVFTGHAEMFSGSSKEIAVKIMDLLKSKGLA